jgi:hypothetical protein
VKYEGVGFGSPSLFFRKASRMADEKKGTEIKGGKQPKDGPKILDGRRGEKGTEILSKATKKND